MWPSSMATCLLPQLALHVRSSGQPGVSKITLEQVGVSPLPVGEGQSQIASCLGGWNMLISASSEMQDEAWEFVQFMTSQESQKMHTPSRPLHSRL